MASIQQLPVKTLAAVLKELRGGSIGFDVFRDDRTNNKAKLLAFILQHHDNASIIAAVTKVTGEDSGDFSASDQQENGKNSATSQQAASAVIVTLHYSDPNQTKHQMDFQGMTEKEARLRAHAWLASNPMMRAVQPGMVLKGSETATQAVPPRPSATAPAMPSLADMISDQATKRTTGNENETPEAKQIAALLASMALKGAVDENKVRAICDDRAQDYVDNILIAVNQRLAGYDDKIAKLLVPTIVEIKTPEMQEPKKMGVQHRNFQDLLVACNAREVSGHRLNVWLHGPAGTGKTHAAHAVADALGLQFQSNGTLLTEHALSGFIDAGGKYHRTPFREVFENGGVYLGDEYDVWNPKAAMWLQAALANGFTAFPDGMIKRHADCIIIFGANTAGKGATAEYSTRNKVDDANANRVIFLEWPLDETLELAISPNPKWTARVQVVRKHVDDRKLKGHLITPRQSLQGAALLAAGMSWDKTEEMVLRRGLSQEQWESIQ